MLLCAPMQLLDMLKFYTGFEINDQTGNALTQKEMTTLHYDRITSLQVKFSRARTVLIYIFIDNFDKKYQFQII